MNIKEIITDILKQKNHITNVYFVACGGSLVDLYPAKYFVDCESETIGTGFYTAKEFVCTPPKKLNSSTITVVCSHSGKTPESIEAAKSAKQAGSSLITLTFNGDSDIVSIGDYSIVYKWGEDVSVTDNPIAIVLSLMNELLHSVEAYSNYSHMNNGLSKINEIVKAARAQTKTKAEIFAQKYSEEPFLYIMGSGASFAHAYGFSICSLMEMQWMNSCYIHSGEYFHGPFEVTDNKTLYVLLMSEGKTRCIDERALSFLQKYASKYEVIDSSELGLAAIDKSVVDYFNPILFYEMSCVYREALAQIRKHPLETRRYMFKVNY